MWQYHRYSELYHHGIKGQKWGVRNGPPYPLDRKSGSINGGGSIGYKVERTKTSKFNRIEEDITFEENLSKVNPHHGESREYDYNCVNDSITAVSRICYNMDVEALGSDSQSMYEAVNECFNKPPCLSISVDGLSSEEIHNRVDKNIKKRFSDGDVGAIDISGRPHPLTNETDGHCFNWRIENDEVKYFDSQPNPQMLDASSHFKSHYNGKQVEICKLNDLEIKEDGMSNHMKNRERN